MEKRKLTKDHWEFVILGLSTMIIAIILMILDRFGIHILHPTVYIIILAMGAGWFSTALSCCISYKRGR